MIINMYKYDVIILHHNFVVCECVYMGISTNVSQYNLTLFTRTIVRNCLVFHSTLLLVFRWTINNGSF